MYVGIGAGTSKNEVSSAGEKGVEDGGGTTRSCHLAVSLFFFFAGDTAFPMRQATSDPCPALLPWPLTRPQPRRGGRGAHG